MALQDHLERLSRLEQRMQEEDEFDSASYLYFSEIVDELKILYEFIEELESKKGLIENES